MKLILAAFCLAFIALPVLAMSIDMSSATPTLTYPEPETQPVTKGNRGISQ
jgi:hypothetical protein